MAKQIKATDIFESEDIFRGIRQSAEQAIDTLGKFKLELKQTADELKKTIGGASVNDTKSINELIAATQKANQVKEQTVKIDQEQEKLRKLSIQSEREEIKLKKDQQAALDREAKAREKVARETAKQNSAYSQESAKLNELRKRYKDLAVQNKENTAEARNLLTQITALDGKLKQIDATVGQHQRNVGNYQQALGRLSGFLGQFGVAFGLGTIVQGATRSVIEFDQAIADLVSITGAGGQDLEFFKEQALTLGKEVEGGASAVIEAYKLIGSAKPELLENAEALNAVTESAITLSQASGMALPDAATALTDAMNQFGAPAEEAGRFIDALANGALFGAAEIPQVTEALLKFGAVANTANVSLEESTGLIEALAEKGLKGAEAGTALRNVMLKLSAPDALPREAQKRLEALGISFADLQDTSKPFSERLESLKPLLNDNAALVKVFGTENAVAATNLIANTDRIADLTEKMYTQGTAAKQAEDRTQTLSQALIELKGAWEEVILGFMNGSGSTQILVKGLQFLAANLGTIISIVGKLVLAWTAYKTITLALQAIDKARSFAFREFGQQMLAQIPLTKQYTAAQKESAAAAKASGESAKTAGSAMSAVPWIAIIALLIEVAKGWYDIASGAADARAKTKLYDDYKKAASEQATENINKETEALDKQLKSLDRQREVALSKAKTDKERNAIELKYAKLRKDEVADTQNLLKQYKDANVQRQIGYKQQRDELSNLYRLRAERKATSADLKRIFEIENELGARVSESDAANATKALNILGAKIRATNVKIAEYSKAIGDSNEMLKDQNKEVEVNTNNQEDNSNKISAKIPKQKEEEKYIRKTTEALKRESEARESLFDSEETAKLLLLDEERAVLASDIAVLEAEIALKRLEGSKDANAIQQAEKALFDARKKQIEEKLKLDLAQTDNVNEQMKLQKEAELAIANLSNKETEVVKMNVEKRNEWVKFATDYFIEQSNKRIAQLDKEIAAAEKQQDTLRELAANGNINARESLAENQRIIDEANRKKAQEERRKQMIELVSGVYQTYNQKVAAGSENALMETIRDTVLLQQFANTLLGNMPTFFDGTENTGTHGEGVDGKGGFHAILHPNERVVPKSLNEKIGSLSNEQLAKVAQEYQNGKLITGTQPMSAIDLSLLVNEMKDLKDVIRNKPETNIELGEITSSVMEIVKTTKQGNTLKTNRFKIRK
jgi:TP901 family phage tail tape measure protein